MIRNKEFKQLIFISILYIVGMITFSLDILNLGKKSSCICIGLSIFMVASYIFLTLVRYKKIERLSDYLNRVQNSVNFKSLGLYELGNYDEGELSILHSEIFKVTRRLIEQTEKLNRDKCFLADSLADISHQLKTPLTSMMISADLLDTDNISADKRHEFIKSIQNQLGRIEWLLSTLLKMSKLDAGTLKITKKEVNLHSLIKKSVEHLLIPIELKNQTLNITGDKDLFAFLDPNWTLEAISNIVKNCAEHTPGNGSINISFEVNPLYTKIIISDNGEGIDKEDIDNIFKRFYKGKNASKESVGIGLAFAKQIINLQDGSISVSSQVDCGTTFEIKFYKHII